MVEDSNALIAVFWSMVRALTSGSKQILNVESAIVRSEPWDLIYETPYPFSARKLKTLTVFSSESHYVSQLISKPSRFFNWLPFSFNYSIKAFSKRRWGRGIPGFIISPYTSLWLVDDDQSLGSGRLGARCSWSLSKNFFHFLQKNSGVYIGYYYLGGACLVAQW